MNEAQKRKVYQDTLPKKRMGAGCLFFDEHGRILLVNPTYKPQWEIPGGVVEAQESPYQCVVREVKEELGLEVRLGRLLCVDYVSESEINREGLMFIFDGGQLTAAQMAQIRLPLNELSEWRFVAPADSATYLTARLAQRVQMALTEGIVYTEDQRPVKNE